MLSKINTYISMLGKDNPKISDVTELKAHKRRITSFVKFKLSHRDGFKFVHQYLTGIISIEKARLKFTRLSDKFNSYIKDVRLRIPNIPHTFDSNVWDVVFNQALVRGEDSALELLETIKAKNIETLDKIEEE